MQSYFTARVFTSRKTMPTIYEIADHILAASPYDLSNRELQKILYLAQGFYLATEGEPLFPDEFQAWKHGPVNTSIYHKFKGYGYLPIMRPQVLQPLSAGMAAFIVAVTLAFAPVGQGKLIEYSHADTPWAANYIPDQNVYLTKDELKNYFKNFASFDDYKLIAEEKLQFHNFINARLQYLQALPNIGNQWISGEAAAPTPRVCEVAMAFLAGMERQLFSHRSRPNFPKIVMGPIPKGGVTLEFVAVNSLYLHFHNSNRVEIDIEQDGHFKDYDVALEQFEENFADLYGMIQA